jgi:hypothetical protein
LNYAKLFFWYCLFSKEGRMKMKTRHKIMSFLLSGAMVFSLLPASAIGTVKAASVNYARTATATASGSEASAFGPEKAKDGDATTKTSR